MTKRIGTVDWALLGCVFALLALGVAIVFGSSVYMAQRKDLASTYFFWKHLANVAAWCAVMFGALLVPARSWERIARPLFVLSVALLVLVLVPGLGKNLNGAQRWFRGPMSVQPSEMSRPTRTSRSAAFFAQPRLTRPTVTERGIRPRASRLRT